MSANDISISKFYKRMKVRRLKPMLVNDPMTPQSTPPINPFCQDHYHVGTGVGSNVIVFEGGKDDKGMVRYLIVVNCMTGEQLEINLAPERYPRSIWEWILYWLPMTNRSSWKEKLVHFVRIRCSYAWWNKKLWVY